MYRTLLLTIFVHLIIYIRRSSAERGHHRATFSTIFHGKYTQYYMRRSKENWLTQQRQQLAVVPMNHSSSATAIPAPSSDGNRSDHSAKRVTFGDVVLHEFGPTIGHNPSVSSGVPIALGYGDRGAPERMTRTRIETYESRRKPRRLGRQLLISKRDRERM